MMRARRFHGAALLVLGLGLLLSLAGQGCGRRGMPHAPRATTPAPPTALRADAQEKVVTVSWARPTLNADGTALYDLQEFRLFRAIGSDPAFTLIATVRADYPQNAVVRGSIYYYRDDAGGGGLDPTLRYTYRVVAVNARGGSGSPAQDVTAEFLAPPPAPTAVTASSGDGLVDLVWQTPISAPGRAAVPVRGYNVYRGVQPGAYGTEPINARPLTETSFRDAGVQSDTTYYYAVRSVGAARPPWRESANSAEVSATPADLTPPVSPQGLTAIPAPGAVELSWRANTEPDLLGYLVYRREPPMPTAVRLTETPLSPTTFTDRSARPGATYVYSVTAVDRSTRRNESAPSAEAEVTVP
jgi:hypothetical protein